MQDNVIGNDTQDTTDQKLIQLFKLEVNMRNTRGRWCLLDS